MYFKLALRNAKRACGDYLIYIATLVVLSALIFSANMLAFLDTMSASAQNAQTLPLLVTLVMAVLMNYINAFMVRRRTKELATYTLLGMEQKTVANLFFIETLAIGFACLLLGMGLGVLLFYVFTAFLFGGSGMSFALSWGAVWKAILRTFIYFGIVQVISLFLIRRKIRKLKIYQLMYGHRNNEKVKNGNKSVLYVIISILSFLVFSFLLVIITSNNYSDILKMISISMISIPIIMGVYLLFIGMMHCIANLRLKSPDRFYRKNRIFVAGQILSRVSSNSVLMATVTLCLLVAATSCIFSMVLFRSTVQIYDGMQVFMCFTQFYICIIFTVIVFTVLALQQIADAKENQYRYAVLQKLGADKMMIGKYIFDQIAITFTAPVLVSGFILVGSVLPLNSSLYNSLGGQNIILESLGIFAAVLFTLYVGYFIITHKTAKMKIAKVNK